MCVASERICLPRFVTHTSARNSRVFVTFSSRGEGGKLVSSRPHCGSWLKFNLWGELGLQVFQTDRDLGSQMLLQHLSDVATMEHLNVPPVGTICAPIGNCSLVP